MQHPDTETLSSYIDGQLPAGEIGEVEAHLAGCPECQRDYQELLGVVRLVRALPSYQPRTSADVQSGQDGRQADAVLQLTRFLRPLAVAALVIVVAIAGLRLIDELTESEPDDGEQIEFSQAPEDGTDSDGPSSQSIAEESDGSTDDLEESAGEAPAQPDESDVDQESALQAIPASTETADTAMAPAASVATEAPADPDEESALSTWGRVRTILYVVMGAAIVGIAIWLLYQRTRR